MPSRKIHAAKALASTRRVRRPKVGRMGRKAGMAADEPPNCSKVVKRAGWKGPKGGARKWRSWRKGARFIPGSKPVTGKSGGMTRFNRKAAAAAAPASAGVNVTTVAQASLAGATQAVANAPAASNVNVQTFVTQATTQTSQAVAAATPPPAPTPPAATTPPPADAPPPPAPPEILPVFVTFTITTVDLNGVLVAVVTNNQSEDVTATLVNTAVGTPITTNPATFAVDLSAAFTGERAGLLTATRLANIVTAVGNVLGSQASVLAGTGNTIIVSPSS